MDGFVSADFLFNIEKKYRVVRESNYISLLRELWYTKLLRVMPFEGKSERLIWLLETALMEQLTPNDGGESGGSLNFDQLSTVTQEFFPAYHARGYKIGKMKWLNALQAGQLDFVESWMAQQGQVAAYYPQQLLAMTLLNGANLTCFDGQNFFSTAHPYNANISGLGSYANTFTGASSGSGSTFYPGALPIDDTQSVDVALINLGKALAYIRGHVRQPNGLHPRNLIPKYIICPPRMQARVELLCNANFIGLAASGGAAAADIKDFLRKYRMTEPLVAPEIDGSMSWTITSGPGSATTTVNGSDTTYYIVTEEASQQQIGAFLENRRLPFTMQYYTGEGMGSPDGVDAVLGRANDLEYHHKGWTAVNVGLPYGIFQFLGS
jgi:hypothetical protein